MSGKFVVEPAKSGRAKCKTCFDAIAKDSVRIGVITMHHQFGPTTVGRVIISKGLLHTPTTTPN